MSTPATFAGDGRKVGARTRDDIIKALRLYGELHGPGFTQAAFNPSTAKWQGRPELVEVYYAGMPDGSPWPSLNSIKAHFDGFNAARLAAGFEPNRPGPRNRREAGKHGPIRDVRERRVLIPSERHRELATRLARTQDRLRAMVERAERAEARVAALRERPEPRPRARPSTTVKTITKTKTKTVKVRDERALERLRSKLADEVTAHRATADQLRAAIRDRDRIRVEAENRAAEAAAADAEARSATQTTNRASDRLAAVESRAERLAAELDAAREQLLGDVEAAAVHDLVRAAEERADAAEIRAARAEREMAEQAQAITGEKRRLTVAELAELRDNGPAGPAVFGAALSKFARARKGDAGVAMLDAALDDVARAAVNWRDRLGR